MSGPPYLFVRATCKGCPVNLLLIGPPGSGKGTQGDRLSARLNIEHLAAGDLLRAEVEALRAERATDPASDPPGEAGP